MLLATDSNWHDSWMLGGVSARGGCVALCLGCSKSMRGQSQSIIRSILGLPTNLMSPLLISDWWLVTACNPEIFQYLRALGTISSLDVSWYPLFQPRMPCYNLDAAVLSQLKRRRAKYSNSEVIKPNEPSQVWFTIGFATLALSITCTSHCKFRIV